MNDKAHKSKNSAAAKGELAVKVIAQNGNVTLKGPVGSEQEKQVVEAKAAQIAGADKVISEIQVALK